MAQAAQEALRRAKFGNVRPAVWTRAHGRTVVGVGNEIWYGPSTTTFPEFLIFYLIGHLSHEWVLEESAKPEEERHSVVTWLEGVFNQLAEQAKEKQEQKPQVLWVKPSGYMKSCVDLAYDIYTLRHHSVLQDRLIERLKIRDQFQGARYEAFVAATMIRAGFDIKFEDEADRSRKHPEFIATDKATGEKMAVEAKSRHRKGVLGQPGQQQAETDLSLRVRPLINKALEKKTDYPYVIFLDINMPPHEGHIEERPWFQQFKHTVSQTHVPDGKKDEFAAIIFTNIPSHYDATFAPAPKGDVLTVGSGKPKKPVSEPSVLLRIHQAASQFGQIPRTFEEAT